jgi:hypothetical protein
MVDTAYLTSRTPTAKPALPGGAAAITRYNRVGGGKGRHAGHWPHGRSRFCSSYFHVILGWPKDGISGGKGEGTTLAVAAPGTP